MTISLFRALEPVRYLLISGQACILYGASELTEDIDLWIDPTTGNAEKFLRALASLDARVGRLTPPFETRFLKKGHGFHFRIGDVDVDVMGRPPRVSDFSSVYRRSRRIKTEWGVLPVIAPEDLVPLKQTDRPKDYGAISNLVRNRVREDESPPVLEWALGHSFDIADLVKWTIQASPHLKHWPKRPVVQALLPIKPKTTRIPEVRISKATRLLGVELGELLDKGRRYWLPIIHELKDLRRREKLIPEETRVSELL
jgi:hypothetical protein